MKLDEISDIFVRNIDRETLTIKEEFYEHVFNYCCIKSKLHKFPVKYTPHVYVCNLVWIYM